MSKFLQPVRFEDYIELYDQFLKYFDIREFVSPKGYEQHGHKGKYFFCSLVDPALMANMIFIREGIDLPIHMNNWHNYKGGTKFTQRGIRDNTTEIVTKRTAKGIVYYSGHPLGQAFDFHINGMSAVDVRKWIVDHADELPYPCRLERKLRGKQISWVHIDVKIYQFNERVLEFDI